MRIGLFIRALTDLYHQEILTTFVHACRDEGILPMVIPGNAPGSILDFERDQNVLYDLVNPSLVDGIIVTAGSLFSYQSYEQKKAFLDRFKGIPIVLLGEACEGYSNVMPDNEAGTRKLVEHFITEHHSEKFVYITGPTNNFDSSQRFEFFKKVLGEHSIPFPDDNVYIGDYQPWDGPEAVAEFLDNRKIVFDTLFAANDAMAIGAVKELQKRGKKIPHDVRVAGFDNIEASSYLVPGLTTVSQDIGEQVRLALDNLVMMVTIDKGATAAMKVPSRPVLRRSCGCYPFQTVDVSTVQYGNALSPVDKNAREEILARVIKKVKLHNNLSQHLQILSIQRIDRLTELLLDECFGVQSGMSAQNLVYDLIFQNSMNEQEVELARVAMDLIDGEVRKPGILPPGTGDYYVLINQARELVSLSEKQFLKRDLRQNDEQLHVLTQAIDNILRTYEISHLIMTLSQFLPRLGISFCAIVLYHPIQPDIGSFPKETGTLSLFIENGVVRVMTDNGDTFETSEILPDGILKRAEIPLIIMPLVIRGKHFGYFLIDIDRVSTPIYHNLQKQISNALDICNLFFKQKRTEVLLKDTLIDLEKSNRQLQDLSLTDELTGLKNRRGFLDWAARHFERARHTGGDFTIFFIDLDGLKKINDKYGHQAGDTIIRAAAKVLKESFRENDIVARMGGDEFTALTTQAEPQNNARILARLNASLENDNAANPERPFRLSFSVGAVRFKEKDFESVEQMIAHADSLLYEEKRRKKGLKS